MARLRVGQFRSWLESMPSDYIVGVPCDVTNCPIANYIVDSLGADSDSVAVWQHYFRYAKNGREYGGVMPKTLSRFVRLIDRDPSPVTAYDALYVLDVASKRS
jgi:hypothetical protein